MSNSSVKPKPKIGRVPVTRPQSNPIIIVKEPKPQAPVTITIIPSQSHKELTDTPKISPIVRVSRSNSPFAVKVTRPVERSHSERQNHIRVLNEDSSSCVRPLTTSKLLAGSMKHNFDPAGYWVPHLIVEPISYISIGKTPSGAMVSLPTTGGTKTVESAENKAKHRVFTPKVLKTPVRPFSGLTPRVISSDTSLPMPEIDPLLETAIYLDISKDDGYHTVANHMAGLSRSINEATRARPVWQSIPTHISGGVSQEIFDRALDLYENNQNILQEGLKKYDTATSTTVRIILPEETRLRKELRLLEHWFVNIAEPMPTDKSEYQDWLVRERGKQTKGHSAYCDPDLIQFLG